MLRSSVGYIGGENTAPTYRSVCSGDGHTEALRLELDPELISYEAFLEQWLEDPRVRTYAVRNEKLQYMTAIWVQDDEQRVAAEKLVKESGKEVPVFSQCQWHDAEDWHQHFLTDFAITQDAYTI